jgi:competence transcription factor ComK
LESFWQQTPRTIHLAFVAKNRLHIRAINRDRGLAWNIASMQRSRRLPKPNAIMLREPKPKQTWQEQLAIVERWVAATAKQQGGMNGR